MAERTDSQAGISPAASSAPATAALDAGYRNLMANASLAVVVVDGAGRYVETNPAARQLSGYSEAEFLGMSLTDIMAPESRDEALQHFATVKTAGHASGELCWVCKDGTRRWSTCDAFKLSEDLFIIFCLDVTERKSIEDALVQSNDELRSICSGLMDGLLIADVETMRFVRTNATMCGMLGYSEAELLAMSGERYPSA